MGGKRLKSLANFKKVEQEGLYKVKVKLERKM